MKWFLIIFSVITSQLFTNERENPCPNDISNQTQCEKYAYNYMPKMMCDRSFNFSVFGEFLYMQAVENGLEYAVLNLTSSNPRNPADVLPGKRIGFNDDWKYKPGIKVGLEYLDKDLFNAQLYWSYVDFDNRSSFSFAGQGTLLPLWLSSFVFVNISTSKDMRVKWSGHFNSLDFKIGKNVYLGKYVLFEPNIGLKAAWIDQKYFVNINAQWGTNDPFLDGTFNGDIDFKGIGIRAGVNTEFHFLKYFYLFGDVKFSILASKFVLFQKSISFNSTPTLQDVEQNQIIRTETPVFENISGVGSNFSLKDIVTISLKVGYETQIWFRQNRFVRFFDAVTPSSGTDSINEDFFLSGLNASLKIQF
ncbi:MAG: hypothetical protein KR126chlam6_00232 [Candidatus Anoxychlamydiales bacterium]|nr:hypothetical protein [Candidatus Anoxychlamydiales bacterium]